MGDGEDDDDDDDDSDLSSGLSDESEGMEDDEPDEGDEGSHGDSIIDMLEEQQMEDQVDGADGWTTDTDSVEEEEEIEEEEVNEDELSGFLQPEWRLNPDEQGMEYSEEDIDDAADIAEFREVMGNLPGQIFDDMQDEEEEDEEQDEENGPQRHHHHHHNWLSIGGRGGTHTLRHGGKLPVPTLFTREGLQFRGGLFGDDYRRNIPHRSRIIFFKPS
jgi:hypothetical protein